MEKIDLTKILKDAPANLAMYSPCVGDVVLDRVCDTFVVFGRNGRRYRFDPQGRLDGLYIRDDECEYVATFPTDTECMLFPSRDLRKWDENWPTALYTRCVGSVIVDSGGYPYLVGQEKLYPDNPSVFGDTIRWEKFDFVGARFATKGETERFFAKLAENGWEYDPDNKTVRKSKNGPRRTAVSVGDRVFHNGRECVVVAETDGGYILKPVDRSPDSDCCVEVRKEGLEGIRPEERVGAAGTAECLVSTKPLFYVDADNATTSYPKGTVFVVTCKNQWGNLKLESADGTRITTSESSDDFRKWKITDAKEGDVLCNGETVILFKEIRADRDGVDEIVCHAKMFLGNGETTDLQCYSKCCSVDKSRYAYADKGTRELFWKSMEKVGLYWSAEGRVVQHSVNGRPPYSVGSHIRYKGDWYRVIKLGKYGYVVSCFDGDNPRNAIAYNEKLETSPFGIGDLKPFDRVLVRDNDWENWTCDIYSHYDWENRGYVCLADCWWKMCIPYNGETEKLLGTDGDYDGQYKTW